MSCRATGCRTIAGQCSVGITPLPDILEYPRYRSFVEIPYAVILSGPDVDSTQPRLRVSQINVPFTVIGDEHGTCFRPRLATVRVPRSPRSVCLAEESPAWSTPADADNPSCVERLERGPTEWKAAPPHHVGMRPLPGEASSYFRREATARHTHAREDPEHK